ncbi:E1-E2 ATPase family protein [Cryptosporidium muris RN66]|uniref:E1-E2 ATPase family protein n=1 Tax=Cryptosporidium muris (strain RN66) TaxID=441375 RepID=B6AJP8_CRYMR|nr:E1-E2 ATPase family protein [Cryptosporidium muris RN66]EEA08439.1 E1-E2 ATPase family protein [Cryptosporidium muris RN66]|eukprot:XP_002142788.1 E1-E2 ATPase family protein [Cryptosporidium muris RN66]
MNWCIPSYSLITLGSALKFIIAIGVYFSILLLWSVYREVYNVLVNSQISNLNEDAGFISFQSPLIGYKTCYIGMVLKQIYMILLVLSQVLLCIVVWNVICASSADILPYWPERAQAYIILYCSGLILAFIRYFAEPQFNSFFMLRDSLRTCSYIKSAPKDSDIWFFIHWINSLRGLDRLKSLKGDVTSFNQNLNSKSKCTQSTEKELSYLKSVKLPLLPVCVHPDGTRYLCHHQVTYCYVETRNEFVRFDQDWDFTELVQYGIANGGLSSKEAQTLLHQVGSNDINLEMPSRLEVLCKELLHPINILRLGSLWQGVFLRFYLWSFLWACMITSTILGTLKIIQKNRESIQRALQNFVYRPVEVKRDGVYKVIPSNELVPGDLILLPNGFVAPCDIYVISGYVLVNETYMSGETSPTIKTPINLDFSDSPSDTDIDTLTEYNKKDILNDNFLLCNEGLGTQEGISVYSNSKESLRSYNNNNTKVQSNSSISIKKNKTNNQSKSSLYSSLPEPIYTGTEIINSLASHNYNGSALGVVFKTGIYSTHGQLLYKILYGDESESSQDSLFSHVGYIRNFVSFWFISMFTACCLILYQNYILGWKLGSFFFAVGTFIQLLPIWAPACIQSSLDRSVKRLDKIHGLTSTVPSRIPFAGKLKVICFDKTGTLTNSKMTLMGVVPFSLKYELYSSPKWNNSQLISEEYHDSIDSIDLAKIQQKSGIYLLKKEYDDDSNINNNNSNEGGISKLDKDSFDIKVHPEQSWESSTISFDEEDPLIRHEVIPNLSKMYMKIPQAISVSSLSFDSIFLLGITCCHTLSYYETSDNKIQYYGNDIDKALFMSTNAELKIRNNRRFIKPSGYSCLEKPLDNEDFPIEVVKINNFDWRYACMSVVVHMRLENRYFVFCKGSLEALSQIIKHKEVLSSEEINIYSHLGYYVMGLAYREITEQNIINFLKYKTKFNISRRILESGLSFLGYLLFLNELRPSATTLIQGIKTAGITPIMVTGDSAYTALSVARKVGIISPGSSVAIGDVISSISSQEEQEIVWYTGNTGNEERIDPIDIYESSDYDALVVTSKALIILASEKYQDLLRYKLESTYILDNEVTSRHINNLYDRIFERIKIFARVTPDQKLAIVQKYIERGIITGMVGDGINDWPALKSAHVGIAIIGNIPNGKDQLSLNNVKTRTVNSCNLDNIQTLSPMTLVFASFNLNEEHLLNILDLIREGRAAMVTTFALFMFIASQGTYYSIFKNILFAIAQANLPVMTYVYIDSFIVFPSLLFMIRSKPKRHLQAYRPTGAFLGSRTLLSFLCLLSINLFFFFNMIRRLFSMPWMVFSYSYNISIPVHEWYRRQDNYEASSTSLWMCFQLSFVAIILSFGGRFRERVTRNKYLILWVLLCHIILWFLLLSGPNSITCLFRVNCSNYIDQISSLKLTGGKFQGPGNHNIFPISWKFEFLFWNYASILCMTLAYWLISSYVRKGQKSTLRRYN